MKKTILFLIGLFLILIACNKDEENNDPENIQSCSSNSGSFDITVAGNEHVLQIQEGTHFTIVYNWFGDEENNISIIGEDQNDNSIYIEGLFPGVFTEGSHYFNPGQNGDVYFDFDLDIEDYSATEITFEIIESNFNSAEGLYKPIKATISGSAEYKTYPNGVEVINTTSFTGNFCLNGGITG